MHLGLALLFLAGPMALLLGLAAPRPGWGLRVALGAVGVLLGAGWLASLLELPIPGGGEGRNLLAFALLATCTPAWAAAAFAQWARPRVAARGRLVYPALVAALLGLFLALIVPMLLGLRLGPVLLLPALLAALLLAALWLMPRRS